MKIENSSQNKKNIALFLVLLALTAGSCTLGYVLLKGAWSQQEEETELSLDRQLRELEAARDNIAQLTQEDMDKQLQDLGSSPTSTLSQEDIQRQIAELENLHNN